MEQKIRIVFEHREGYKYVTCLKENGDFILESVPVDLQEKDKAEHFVKISVEDRKRVAEWLENQEKKRVSRQSAFLHDVKQALNEIDYDYFIANLEPSIEDGKIYYKEGEDVGVGFGCSEWKEMAEKYCPERGSRLAKINELILWYAVRIVDELWTLEFVSEDSSKAGNYHNAPDSARTMQKTGDRVCGGYKDGQGNSYRIVTVSDYTFALVGGDFYDDGRKRPVAFAISGWEPPEAKNWGAGVIVLTK